MKRKSISDEDEDALPLTKAELAKLKRVAAVKRLRWELGLTQEAFAERYGIPLGTLRDWEQGRAEPDATARTYLKVTKADPKKIAKIYEAA
jgi:putative transcriptional regulator